MFVQQVISKWEWASRGMFFKYKLALLHLLTLLTLSSVNVYADVNRPVIPHGKGTSCVEPVDIMRKNHMVFLLHKRDQTMHEGIRTKKYSLKECINCHVQKNNSGQYISINAEGQFCQSCHSYASVHIDCFECHATKPDTDQTQTAEKIDKEKLGVDSLTGNLEQHLQSIDE